MSTEMTSLTESISGTPGGAGRRTMDPWFARDPRLKTAAAVEQARNVTERAMRGATGDRLTEAELFAAMHTCAYRANVSTSPANRLRWKQRWQVLRSRIVEDNLGLAYSSMSRFTSADHDDLLSDAMYGLTRAVDRFNPWKGYRFSTYACNCILRACIRNGKRERRRREVLPVSFDVPWTMACKELDDSADLHLERLRAVMRHNAAELTDIESRVLSERFPASGKDGLTFKQIAGLIGLSKERVRQIQNIALTKLRTVLDADPLLQ